MKRISAIFYRTAAGNMPVRDWLMKRDKSDRKIVGEDIATVEYGWPIGMPTCRQLNAELWEVRSNISSNRIARVIFTIHKEDMFLLHAFVKKTQATPQKELDTVVARSKELVSWLTKSKR